VAAIAFSQGWNVEAEVSNKDGDRDDDRQRGSDSSKGSAPSGPITARQMPA
jgi:hypothetical protein